MSALIQIGRYQGRNPFIYFTRNVVLKRFYGHQELRAAERFVLDNESPFAKTVASTEQTSTQLSLVYLHFWLLEFHLINQSHNFKLLSRSRLAHFIKLRQLSYLSDILIQTEHVHKYSNEFDDQVNDELRRMRLVVRHSLSAFFIHQRKVAEPTEEALKEQLNQVVAEIIMREDEECASKVAKYLRESVQNENFERFNQRMVIWSASQIDL